MEWAEIIKNINLGVGVTDIGQINQKDKRKLDNMVKNGKLMKIRMPWANIGPMKDNYFKMV